MNFSETLYFRYKWVSVIAIISSMIPLATAVLLFIEGYHLITLLPLLFLLFWILFFIKLKITIDIDSSMMTIRFHPIPVKRRIQLRDIEKIKIKDYQGFFQFSGVGVKMSNNQAAFINGAKKYIEIKTISGYTCYISTERPQEIATIILDNSSARMASH